MISLGTIGIDYTPAYEQGAGIGRLTRDLVTALLAYDSATQYKLFVSGASHSELKFAPAPNGVWKSTRLSPTWLARIWHRTQLPVPVEAFTGQVDLYHATDFTLPPTLPSTKTIVTVHDLSFVRVPDAASARLRAYLNAVVPRSVRRATHVLADSQATKDDLCDLYGLQDADVTALLSGIDARYEPTKDIVELMTTRNKYSISDKPYIFSIGTVQPRKNYSRLIRALKIIRERGLNVQLVIAGGKGWLEGEMYQTLDETGMREHVNLIGFVDDEDVPALYSGAECVAYVSLYEGFGFPVLEGMACGTPVVTSNVSSLPEVAGDVAIMVDPYEVEAIADAIETVLTDSDLRNDMIQRGYTHARQFTWEKSARKLHTIYRDILAM
ncbi:MAG: glycosyltransferase family 1 protein [Chloroflexota bacterium]